MSVTSIHFAGKLRLRPQLSGLRLSRILLASMALFAPHYAFSQIQKPQSINPRDCIQNGQITSGCELALSEYQQGQHPARAVAKLDPEQNKEHDFVIPGPIPPAPTPPDPPSEFVKYVSGTIDEVLPRFGSALFRADPSTFASVERSPALPAYVLGAGDELHVRVWGQVNLDLPVSVDNKGAIYVPQIGELVVAGLKFEQVEGFLRSAFGRVWRNFDLSVNLDRLRSIQIYVLGNARRPGVYTVSALSTLIDAVFISGGPAPHGSMRHIELKRHNRVLSALDLYPFLMNGDKTSDVRLETGDVISIAPVGPEVAISGSVTSPGIFEVDDHTTVASVLRFASGFSPVADRTALQIQRIAKDATRGSSRETLNLNADAEALTALVGNGDILTVRTILPRFDKTITIRGHVTRPGRFPWKSGLCILDVVPVKEALVTRSYWNAQTGLGAVPSESLSQFSLVKNVEPQVGVTRIGHVGSDVAWNYATIERRDPAALDVRLIVFNPGRLFGGDAAENHPLLPGDIVTFYSQDEVTVPVNQKRQFIHIEGEVNAPGVYEFTPGQTLRELLRTAGGTTGQAYMFGSALFRESTRIDQQARLDDYIRRMQEDSSRNRAENLGRLGTSEALVLERENQEREKALIQYWKGLKPAGRVVLALDPQSAPDSTALDIPLEDADRFLIPRRPSTVNVFGAVYGQNSFIYKRDEMADGYLKLAGGLTRIADSKKVFVIQADGSIKTAAAGRGLHIRDIHLSPGDTIVVPERPVKNTKVRAMQDWAQAVSQFGLGAAAINVLR